jgi:hypothetical protein
MHVPQREALMTAYFLNPSTGSAIGTEGNDIFSTPISAPYFY